jgi:hypothetical protein
VDYVFNHHLGHCTGGVVAPPLQPSWVSTFVLRNSTFAYLCNFTGFFDPVLAGQFALVGFDQSTRATFCPHFVSCKLEVAAGIGLIIALVSVVLLTIPAATGRGAPSCADMRIFNAISR